MKYPPAPPSATFCHPPQVYAIGLDEFLWLLRLWSGLVVYYLGRDWRRGQQPSVAQPAPGRAAAKPKQGGVGQGLVAMAEAPQGEVGGDQGEGLRDADRHLQ